MSSFGPTDVLCNEQRTTETFVRATRISKVALGHHSLVPAGPRASVASFVALTLAFAASGCGQPTTTATPQASAAPVTTSLPAASPSTAPSVGTPPAPSPSGSFAFDPESIVGYYLTLGYTCSDRQPSSEAAGHAFESCQLVDRDGRTRTLGIVTDGNDDLADAFFSIRGAEGESVLDPAAVIEPFGAFLGAVLGEAGGTEALPWVAGHLGDSYATMTVGDLTFATYTDSPDDHAKITIEIANQAYLDSPRPSGSPVP